jgi:hypothetical protein
MKKHARPNITTKRVISHVYHPGPPLGEDDDWHLMVLQRRIIRQDAIRKEQAP